MASYGPGYGLMVSQTTGFWALTHGAIRAGEPGFGSGPIYSFDGGQGVGIITYSFGPSGGASVVSTSTGVNATETSYALYGHIVPLSVFGIGRIGGDIIAGPWVANNAASFCISFGVPADPNGSRSLTEIAFDSEVVWTSAGGFSAEGFTYRWYPGTLTQAADPIEIAHYGADAVAYRPQMLLWFENLTLANTKFNKIPYVAAMIEDSTGHDVNLGEAFERLAYSPWVGYTSAQFDTSGITDVLIGGGLIIAQDAEFLSTIQQFGRFYQSWDILQTDKLRIVDRGAAVTADINLDRTRLTDKVMISRAATTSVPRVLELSTIDPTADYTVVPSTASFRKEPVAVTTSVSTESVFLPMIMDSSTRQSLVTYAKYQEEVARKKVSGMAMMYGVEIEPGDLVALLNLGDDFVNEVYKVRETTHGINYVVEFVLESMLRCSLVVDDGTDPDFIDVVLLLGFEGLDGSQGAPGFTDESLKHQGTANVANSPQIDTSQFKFGSSSLLITGSAPLVAFNGTSDFFLSDSNSDQFTIECWARFTSFNNLPSFNSLVNKSLGANFDWGLSVISTGSTGGLMFQSAAIEGVINVDVRSLTTDMISTGIWYHLAVDKDSSGTIRLYINGAVVGSATPADSSINHNLTSNVIIGASGFGGNALPGWIDEVRVSKGVARYKTDRGFTPPTAPFPRVGPP
jgi:hypothetical protein